MIPESRTIVPFKRFHYDWLAGGSLPGEGYTIKLADSVLAQLEGENSWTGVVDGEPIVCAGTIQQWPGRHQAWAYLAPGTAKHMRWVTRGVNDNLQHVKGRIELTVRSDFAAGLRWARLLGFEVETPTLQGFGPFGEDHVGFVRMNR